MHLFFINSRKIFFLPFLLVNEFTLNPNIHSLLLSVLPHTSSTHSTLPFSSEKGEPQVSYHLILVHQVTAGLGISSPSDARKCGTVRGNGIHRQTTGAGTAPTLVVGGPV